MSTNDRNRLRVSATQGFVDSMIDGDRAAVVDFTSSARTLLGLSGDHDAIKSALAGVRASGGTNLAVGVSRGLDILDASGDSTKPRFIVLLTDGEGTYYTSLTQRAADAGVVIHTVALGTSVDAALLQAIADGTGGQFLTSATAEDLAAVFADIRDITAGEDCVLGLSLDEQFTVDEGSTVSLDASFAEGVDPESAIVSWDLDGDGNGGDAFGPTANFSARLLDGPTSREVSATACTATGYCETASTTVTVENVAPHIVPVASRFAAVDEEFTIVATWSDPAGAADAPYSVQWSWLDSAHEVSGSTDEVSLSVPDVGESLRTVQVADNDGATSETGFAVTGVRRPLSCQADGVEAAVIWPPNHKFVDVGIVAPVQADGTAVTAEAIYVHQDELLDAQGDGDTSPDARIEGGVAQVRAERSGTGDGRVYTIGYLASAEDGRTCVGEVFVSVPHSARDRAVATEGVRIDSFTGESVEPADAPSASLPQTLERTTAPIAAMAAEGGTVELVVEVSNGQPSDQIGILGTGPTLGGIASVGSLQCDAWGDGTTCTAEVAYQAGSTHHGTDNFSLAVVADGVAWEIPVSVAVTAVNAAPALVVSPSSIDVAEDGAPTQIRLAGWDSETDAADLTYALAAAPEHGALSAGGATLVAGDAIDPADELWFSPDPDFSGHDEFVVAVTDVGDGDAPPLTTQVTVPVNVRDVADAPTFVPSDLTVMEDHDVVHDFVVQDSDSLAVSGTVSAAPSQGAAVLEGVTCTEVGAGSECALSVRYTPDANVNGTDAFTLTATDGVLETEFAVSVTIYAVNDAPTLEPLTRQVGFGDTLELTRAELLAVADAGAPNESAQQLSFTVTSPVPDVAVVVGEGFWRLVPADGVHGTFELDVQVCDDGATVVVADHQCAQSTLTLTVLEPNTAPTADAVTAPTDEDMAAVFDIVAHDADGDALSFTVVGSVAHATVALSAPDCVEAGGASTCTVSASVAPEADFHGIVGFVVRASDGAASVDIPVTVAVSAVNDAPTLTVPPSVTVAEDSSVDVAAVASDADSPTAATAFRLVEAPEHGALTVGGTALAAGDPIPGSVASLTYAPEFDYVGDDHFVVAAFDAQGATSAPATVAVTVTEVNDVPTVAPRILHVTAGGTLSVTSQELLDGATPGPANESGQTLTVDSFTFQSDAPAHVTANGDSFDIVVDATASAQFVGTLRVCDNGTTAGVADPQCTSVPVNFTVGSVRPDLSAPVILLSDATVPSGSQAVITVQTYDASGPVTVQATVGGQPVAVGSDGKIRFTATAAGYYAVVVTATDALGFSATARTSITVLGADDGVAPAVAITAPADGDTVTAATSVVGSVGDAALTHWRLTVTAQGAFAADAIVIAEGDSAVTSGELGTIDPTVLAAGQYVLRLEAIDKGGRIGYIERPVMVGNVGKYGTFSMTFTDAVVPVAGIPLTVQRTYSSGARSQAGDFGYGWSLSINTLRLERDTVSGDQWVRENHGTFLPNFVLVPTSSHTVTVVDGAGKSIVFDFTPTFIDPITDGRYATASWTERTDTGATLAPLDTTELVFASGYLISLDDALVYDPDAYRLTLADGRVLDFDLTDGLTRIEDAAGNVITIAADSIESSTGESIAMTRDADGRITSVSTPSGAATSYGYNEAGNLTSVTDAGGNLTSYAYDGSHYLTGIVDPLGRIPSRQEYDDDGRLVAVVDAAGHRTEINADPDTRTTTVTDRLGHTTVQQFDPEGYLVGQTFADGTSESYTVDGEGNRLTRTDGAGATWTATYDAHDNRTSVTDPLGNTRSFTYDAKNRLTSATDAVGNTTSVDYDAFGNVLAVHLPDGASTSYTYDAQGNTLTETDESGRTQTSTYDVAGRLLTSTSPGGDVTTYTYDADGRLVSRTSPEGAVTGTTYDARGLATEVQNALGGATTSTFDAAGQRTATKSASGVNVTMTYDDLGRVTERTTSSGTTTYAYDLEGRAVRVETPDGVVRETSYDSRGRVTEVRENGAVVSAMSYDDAGRVATSTNALGDTATYAYDAAGRLTDTTRADGTAVSTTYDAVGRALSVTSPSGTTTYTYDARGRVATAASSGSPTVTYSYDPSDRVLSQSSTDGSSMTFTYDADGRLATATDANGSAAAITYDGDGRRLTVDDANGHERTWVYDDGGNLLSFDIEGVRQLTQAFDAASRVTSRAIGAQGATTYAYGSDGRLATVDAPDAAPVQYAYTSSGMLASVTDARGTTGYTYDSRSRLTQVTAPEGSIGYTYDAASRVASVTTSAGVTSYVRDALGRVTGVTDPAGGHYVLGRDDAGRVVSVSFANGVSEDYTYDSAGRPLTVTVAQGGAVLSSFEVTRDEAGRIATFLDSLNGDTRSGSFDYDAGGRLTGVSSTDGAGSTTSTFTLDAAGNRTQVTGDGAETATFNKLDQLVSGGGASYSYDASGFLTQITDATGTTDLSYSSAGELLGVDGPAGAVSYGYDSSGVLVSRTDATGTVGFVNDATGSLPHAVAASDRSWWVWAA